MLKNNMNYQKLRNGSSIHIKKSHEGKFTDYCGGKVTEECIEKGKHSTSAKVRKQATFAANARKWKHKEGGILKFEEGSKTPMYILNPYSNYTPIDTEEKISPTESTTSQTSTDTSTTNWWETAIANLENMGTLSTSSSRSSGQGPRGFRNNNPLNLRITTNNWAGKRLNNTDGSFEQFDTMANGYRAALKDIQNKIKKGTNTISKIITQWAPQSDNNDTQGYIAKVVEATGIDPNKPLDYRSQSDLTNIVLAMAKVENGIDGNMDDVIAGWNALS